MRPSLRGLAEGVHNLAAQQGYGNYRKKRDSQKDSNGKRHLVPATTSGRHDDRRGDRPCGLPTQQYIQLKVENSTIIRQH
ncbi:protein of unknown function [Rhodovastum atsumiense]|nr:protein of unknown function [Rhodovastum atsumiense]